jgi:hypothetical protein
MRDGRVTRRCRRDCGCGEPAKRVHTGGMAPRNDVPRARPKNSPFRDQPPVVPTVYEVGERVTHDRHGLGTVVRLDDDRVDVRFGAQTVSLSTSSTRLHPL